ncbi:hypothetical protein V5F32_16370 [Xanthobacter oligotrophicus]|uniref:DUF5343 domain-containing protein n=1 Tax=Xanthobacter oligotrophicus TaxID=2607286 RepID=A0ABW6ZYC3_9HYPH
MAKARSPSYPAISLKEAIERVRGVYEKDYQNPIPRTVAADHMGYQSLNGKSLGVLSALLKYGLLEGRGDDTRVSDLAVRILAYGSGEPERIDALQVAASKPELFADIEARFKDGRASDQAIRSYLLTQKFIPAAADAAIRAYKETKQFVLDESDGYPRVFTGGSAEVDEHQSVLSPALPSPPRLDSVQSQAIAAHAFDDLSATDLNHFRIVDQGAAIHVRGYVDRKGLDKLIKRLVAYKAVLDANADDDDEAVE